MDIFVVEDDEKMNEELRKLLESNGYSVQTSFDFTDLSKRILESNASLVLLDINIPSEDGFQLCRKIRKVSNMPIIVVTSRNTSLDELLSLNLGADDFISKPYDANILLAHIESVLRRFNKYSDVLSYKGISYYPNQSYLTYQDKRLDLSSNENKIMLLLIKNGGNIVSRSDMMDSLWQTDCFIDDNTLTVNINRLRHKLNDVGIDFLATKRGQGYVL